MFIKVYTRKNNYRIKLDKPELWFIYVQGDFRKIYDSGYPVEKISKRRIFIILPVSGEPYYLAYNLRVFLKIKDGKLFRIPTYEVRVKLNYVIRIPLEEEVQLPFVLSNCEKKVLREKGCDIYGETYVFHTTLAIEYLAELGHPVEAYFSDIRIPLSIIVRFAEKMLESYEGKDKDTVLLAIKRVREKYEF